MYAADRRIRLRRRRRSELSGVLVRECVRAEGGELEKL
jgi:hypothetical protein